MSVAMRGNAGGMVGELNHYPGLGDGGGYLTLYADNFNGLQHDFQPDFNGDGAWMFLKGGGGGYFNWDGNTGGGGQLVVSGPASTSYFTTQSSGDAAVSLPNDAIASAEVLDEPGITQSHVGPAGINFTSTSGLALSDILLVQISTPAAGYIVVQADAQIATPPGSVVGYQISETSGGPQDDGHYFFAGASASTWLTFVPSSTRRTYYKPAGLYTFYFQGWESAVGSGTPYAWNPTITAQYFPTSYGVVAEVANATQAATFDHATPVAASVPRQQGVVAGEAFYSVDLRELELRAKRMREELAAVERNLATARVKQQQETSATFRAARGGISATPATSPKEER